MMGGAKGIHVVCCYSAILAVCRNYGYLCGYLIGLVFTVSRLGVCRRSDLLVHFLVALFMRGKGVPPHYAGLSCVRQATGRSSGLARFSLCLFHVFFRFYFFDFSRLFYIGRCLPDSYFLHVFERDTPMDLVI